MAPRSVREEIWRLRWLASLPAGCGGSFTFRGCTLRFSDGRPVLDQLGEVFLQNVYDFSCEHSSPRILDCGAHVGIATLRFRERFPQARITAFEADSRIADLLRQNLPASGDTVTEIVAGAAWVADGLVPFEQTGSDNGHLDSSATGLVPARDLSTFCCEPIDFLKLDIEGAEDDVIRHLHARRVLRNVRSLACEWHEWTASAPRLHEVLALLVEAGFVYRIARAGCLGEGSVPAFPALGWPGNHVMVYAWQASEFKAWA